MNLIFSNILLRYDVTGELMMLALDVILILIVLVTKPKDTRMFRICYSGINLSFVTIIIHILLLHISCSRSAFNALQFNILYGIYVLCYVALLNIIYGYIRLLSYDERHKIKKLIFQKIVFSVIYLVIAFAPLVSGKMYVVASDGSLMFTHYFNVLEYCGVLCAFLATVETFIHRKSVSKIVFWGVTLFCPMEIVILLLNYFFKNSFFISFTYVIPFLIFYLLFHSYIFDDIIGCQHSDALESTVNEAIKSGKKYVLINVTIPQLKKREFAEISSLIEDVSSAKCRNIERYIKKARIYTSNLYTYTLFGTYDSQDEIAGLSQKIKETIEEPFQLREKKFSISSKQIVITDSPLIKDFANARSMIGFLSQKLNTDMDNECIVATQKDYEDYTLFHKVEQAVLDIAATGNIDDERIVCYIQPIYNVETNSFRTGEALLRFKLEDKLIPPSIVIAAAEMNNCIHPITIIMLNKVCSVIKNLEEQGFDFDAITVNCSTVELADINFHNELLLIVESSGIDVSHLRVEITESTTISNYGNILMNMEKLNSAGISFYLDDFGTGYSNLERISSYPFKTIKFDKSILYSAIKEDSANKLVRMMVKYFHENNFHTVVEGVEDEFQYNYCCSIGFEYIQGFLFSKPLPCQEITDFFKKK